MTTPKEKAEELVWSLGDAIWDSNGTSAGAIKCALIAVNAVIEETKHYQDLVSVWQDSNGTQTVIDRVKYWQEVKNELNKM